MCDHKEYKLCTKCSTCYCKNCANMYTCEHSGCATYRNDCPTCGGVDLRVSEAQEILCAQCYNKECDHTGNKIETCVKCFTNYCIDCVSLRNACPTCGNVRVNGPITKIKV